MELRHLVHDLKSPLTSMQALVGVVKLSAGRRGDQTEGEYLERIETMIGSTEWLEHLEISEK